MRRLWLLKGIAVFKVLSIVSASLMLIFSSCRTRSHEKLKAEGSSAQADTSPILNPCLNDFVKWETTFNHAERKSPTPILLKHYEVPLKLLVENSNPNLTTYTATRQALVHVVNGEEFVRFVINPTDQYQHKVIEKVLAENNLDSTPVSFFWGWPTASRSYVVQDPVSKFVFSLKTSTRDPGGEFTNKRLHTKEVNTMRATSDYAQAYLLGAGFKYLVLQEEAVGFYHQGKDIGILARSLGELLPCTKKYLPMFSAYYPGIVNDVPMPEGQTQFLLRYVYGNFGRAAAEFMAILGLTVTSAHTQNFLLELNLDGVPTGRIVFRDFADGNVYKDFALAAGALSYAVSRAQSYHADTGKFRVIFIPENGNAALAKVGSIPKNRMSAFVSAFKSTFFSLTGVLIPEKDPGIKLNSVNFMVYKSGDPMEKKTVNENDAAWKKWLEAARCYLNEPTNPALSDEQRRLVYLGSCGISP
jgi:hypothetical protein